MKYKKIKKARSVEEILNDFNVKNKAKNNNETLAEVKNLILSFKNPANPNKDKLVIRNTSIHVKRGEVHAIIGESGSGKSVISSSMFGLLGNNAIINSGKVIVNGKEVQNFTQRKWEKSKLRGSFISAVFQNPMTTLNPTMKIGKQIMEGLLINKIAKNKKEAYKVALHYLEKTKINNPKQAMRTYPHALSGGMKQRAVISAIIACQPSVIVFDEPTTALDPTIQAEILEIIKNLISETNLGVIFITHDIGVVASIADRISIMYAGQVVEKGTTEEILFNPQHPYTWGLLLSMPDINKSKRLKTIPGAVPGSLNDIIGDAFAPRNDYALGVDFQKEPPMFQVSNTHYAKTWLLDKRAQKIQAPLAIQNRWKKFKSLGVNND